MAGLFGDFMNMDDPIVQMSLGLLGAQGSNFGGNLAQAAMFAQQQREAMEKRKREQGQLEMQQMQIKQAQQAMKDQEAKRALAQQFGPKPIQNLTPNDDMGNPMPGGMTAPDYHGYAQAMFAQDPAQALGLQSQLSQMNDKGYEKLGAGDSLYDKRTNRIIASAPDKPPAGFTRGPAGLVGDPEYLRVQKEIRAAGRPQVNVDLKQEGEFGKKMGAHFADNYNDILRAGASANGRMVDLGRFKGIVEQVPTGKLEPLKAEVSRLAASLGVKVDAEKLGFQDALESLSNQYALQLRNPSGGAGMPGALSDKDREFLVSMVPGLGKTPGGNLMIIEAFKRVAQRDAEVAKLARQYKERTGRFDEGFYSVLAQEFGSKDMLGDLYSKVSTLSTKRGDAVYRFDSQGNPLQ